MIDQWSGLGRCCGRARFSTACN